MLDCLTASPCVEAYRAEPMTTSEIDAHPDRARIWATIHAVRGEMMRRRRYYGDLDYLVDSLP